MNSKKGANTSIWGYDSNAGGMGWLGKRRQARGARLAYITSPNNIARSYYALKTCMIVSAYMG
jgi:hypothetical protein